MSRRILLVPDYVTSQTDGQRHYINPAMLMDLYQLSRDERSRARVRATNGGAGPDDEVLGPRYDGNYTRETRSPE